MHIILDWMWHHRTNSSIYPPVMSLFSTWAQKERKKLPHVQLTKLFLFLTNHLEH